MFDIEKIYMIEETGAEGTINGLWQVLAFESPLLKLHNPNYGADRIINIMSSGFHAATPYEGPDWIEATRPEEVAAEPPAAPVAEAKAEPKRKRNVENSVALAFAHVRKQLNQKVAERSGKSRRMITTRDEMEMLGMALRQR